MARKLQHTYRQPYRLKFRGRKSPLVAPGDTAPGSRNCLHKSRSDPEDHWTLRAIDKPRSRMPKEAIHLYPGGDFRWFWNMGKKPKRIVGRLRAIALN
ncbi:hypothetical protein Hypma_000664 [Hypsizygus marmoreus]|uniref:Uncharacterized protein n=1 Tax=Hypsizygus marmoreus TaxID=39966 RepID=A0A369JHG1_HYPMA|nr:hypothetical protein Hypma_000664 [Hypsizygus marmoreus]